MNPTTAKICYRLTLGYRRRYDNKSCIGIGLQSLRHALFHLITVMTLVKSLDSTAFQSPVIEMGYKKSKKKKGKESLGFMNRGYLTSSPYLALMEAL